VYALQKVVRIILYSISVVFLFAASLLPFIFLNIGNIQALKVKLGTDEVPLLGLGAGALIILVVLWVIFLILTAVFDAFGQEGPMVRGK
jgi:hypothetical protein